MDIKIGVEWMQKKVPAAQDTLTAQYSGLVKHMWLKIVCANCMEVVTGKRPAPLWVSC